MTDRFSPAVFLLFDKWPQNRQNDRERERKHLTDREVSKLIEATAGGRNVARDRCLMLLMYRHGLRVSEACGLNRKKEYNPL